MPFSYGGDDCVKLANVRRGVEHVWTKFLAKKCKRVTLLHEDDAHAGTGGVGLDYEWLVEVW